MADIIDFRTRSVKSTIKAPSAASIEKNVDVQDIEGMMSELVEIIKECESMDENPTEYSNMVVQIMETVRAIAKKYEVAPRTLISDLMYVLASREILENIATADLE